MSDIEDISTDDLVEELTRRGAVPKRSGGGMCGCRKWATYVGAYDRDGYTLRCHGCLRAVARCTCR